MVPVVTISIGIVVCFCGGLVLVMCCNNSSHSNTPWNGGQIHRKGRALQQGAGDYMFPNQSFCGESSPYGNPSTGFYGNVGNGDSHNNNNVGLLVQEVQNLRWRLSIMESKGSMQSASSITTGDGDEDGIVVLNVPSSSETSRSVKFQNNQHHHSHNSVSSQFSLNRNRMTAMRENTLANGRNFSL